MMRLSIIIPTLEEEKYLSLLLESINPVRNQRFLNGVKKQNIKRDYEIIVADAGSKDKTVEIAKKYGCQVVKGGLPARGRNEGAKVAKGELFLFLDADMILPESSLNAFLFEFEKRNLDVAGFLLQPCPARNASPARHAEASHAGWHSDAGGGEGKILKILYNLFYNWPVLIMERILPHSEGAILIKKSLFSKINGFDEELKLGEDSTCSRRAHRFGKFGILRAAKIYYSQRRFERDGSIKTWLKYFLADLHLIFLGPIKSDIFKYDLQSKRFRD